MSLPAPQTLKLTQEKGTLFLILNRPQVRNAMSLEMVIELCELFDAIEKDSTIRTIVIRGEGQHFCAGADIKDLAQAREHMTTDPTDPNNPIFKLNRAFGHLMTKANQSSKTLICVLEGAVLGGGFGLAAVSDIALSLEDARFGLPETGLGVIPAQIAPFVVLRIGLTQTRYLALTGTRFNGLEAARIGLVHLTAKNTVELEAQLQQILQQVNRCAPQANATTKKIMLKVGSAPLEQLLDEAALDFSCAAQGVEGREGTLAFLENRTPSWVE